MVRFPTVAALLGVFTGLWVLLATYGLGENWGWLAPTFGIVLTVDSLFCLVGPRRIFYASAVLALLVAASAVLYSSLNTIVILTLGLAVVVAVSAVMAARRQTRMSEQSNPMNLPVFG